MSCCHRKPQQVKAISEKQQEALLSLKILKSFMDAKPSKLSDKVLLDYHKKTHMLYAGNVNRNPPNKNFINSIVDLHDKFVKEMLRRKMNHNTPLQKI